MKNEDMLLLKDAIDCDIINELDVSELIKMTKKQKVKTIHKRSITDPTKTKKTSRKTSRWQTYVKDENGADRKISAMTEDRLYEKLYDFYFVNVVPTVTEFFPEWLKIRSKANISDRTIQRYRDYWAKYYASDAIVSKKLNMITHKDIEDFYHKKISEHALTYKELSNMKVILKNILQRSLSDGIINHNPFQLAVIETFGCMPPNKPKDESRIYLEHERDLMFELLNEEIKLYPELTDMHGIFLLFSKGLRIAELAALKISDVDLDTKQIYIHRMETIVEVNGEKKVVVVNYGKKRSPFAIRWLDLTDFEVNLIKDVLRINHENGYEDDGFLFLDEDGRTNIRSFDYRIRKLCRKGKLPEKSAHDIRRSTASFLYAFGFSLKYIREYLGHQDLKTTESYIYDLNSKEQNRKLLNNSLQAMNGLERTSKSHTSKNPQTL